MWALAFVFTRPADLSSAMVMDENSRIYVAGHRGLVGSAIWRELERQGYKNLSGKTRAEVNLLDTAEQYPIPSDRARPGPDGDRHRHKWMAKDPSRRQKVRGCM